MLEITRVHPPLRSWAILGGSIGFGFIHGANLWYGWVWPTGFAINGVWGSVDEVVGRMILLLPWAIILHYRCQRLTALIMAAFAVGTSSAIAFSYGSAMASPLGAAAMLQHIPWMGAHLLYWTTEAVLLNASLFAFARLIGYRVIEQDGSLCNSCGYHLIGTVCSECGEHKSCDRRCHRAPYGQAIVAGMLFCAAIATAWALWQPTHDVRMSFIKDYGAEGSFHGHMYNLEGRALWPSVGVFFDLEQSSGMILTWLYEEWPQDKQPYMQLQVMAKSQAPAGNVLPGLADPIVLVNIECLKLARRIREQGLTLDTKMMLRDMAVKEGWRPVAPGTAGSGRVVPLSPEVIGIGGGLGHE